MDSSLIKEKSIQNSREIVNEVLSIKKNINETVRERLYIKNFDSKLIDYLCELDDLSSCFNVEIIQVLFK
jgi:hypothetical protein